MSRRLPLLVTFMAIITSFIAGFFCAFVLEPTHHSLRGSPLSKLSVSDTFNSFLPLDNVYENSTLSPTQAEPLGLSTYRKSYENPWSFSTLRTGVDQLMHSFEKVMSRDGSLPRVVVSFTSLPRRFDVHGNAIIRLLKQQTYLPDAIYIAIPKASRRSNESFSIPKWIRKDPLITVLRPTQDYGPATKLIPAVEEELRLGNTNTRIITIDDDNEGKWTSKSLLNLYAYALHFEDAAIGLTGWNVTCMLLDSHCTPEDSGVPLRQFRNKHYNFIRQANDYACHSLFDWMPDYYANCMGAVRKNHVAFADVLEGYKGVVYQPRFFDVNKLKSIINKDVPEWFLLVDDVWFSAWLGVKGISRFVVNPAIDENTHIALALKAHSERRNISREIPIGVLHKPNSEVKRPTEKALHSLGLDFVDANHKGVRWFEELGAWNEDLWKKPEGFMYPSEMTSSVQRVYTSVNTDW